MWGLNLYFIALLVTCAAYALTSGGPPERIAAAVYALSCVATEVALRVSPGAWQAVETGVFIIDTAIFGFFCVLALRVDRFWTIWVSALLGLGVLGHLARWLVGPAMGWWPYAVSLTIWSYPILALMAVGTLNHQRSVARGRPAIAPRARA